MTTRETLFASALAGTVALFGCNSGGTTDDAGTGTDSGGPVTPTCAAYCTAITANCHDANRQWGDAADEAMSNCMAACPTFHWAVGTAGDTSGNTLGCHLYHAGAAAMDPVTHCPHAGPLGAGVCGDSNCANFCANDIATCTASPKPYTDMADCMTKCAAYSDATTASVSPTQTAGNTLACRAYHLSVAADGMPADNTTHCPHTGMTSATCM